jgi:arsenate reductase
LLEDAGIPYRYREYTREPLDEDELRALFARLSLAPRDLLRRRDKAYRELGLTGDEPDDRLIRLMAEHPTLLERPIGVHGNRAVVGRPPDRLLQLVERSS